jgi:hypothetical protein
VRHTAKKNNKIEDVDVKQIWYNGTHDFGPSLQVIKKMNSDLRRRHISTAMSAAKFGPFD